MGAKTSDSALMNHLQNNSPGGPESGNYMPIEDLKAKGFTDNQIIKLADDGKVILGRWDGPRIGLDESQFVKDNNGTDTLYHAIALPRKR
jgi:hypothetical protein